MRIFIILAIMFFIFSAFFGDIQTTFSNPILAYILFLFNMILKNFFIFLFAFLVIFFLFFRQYFSKKISIRANAINSLIQVVSIIFISIFSAFAILFIIAIIELNIFAVILNLNPKILGVKTDAHEIYNAIKFNNRPPEIIASDKNSQKEVMAFAKASGGTNSFYGNKILTSIPNFLILPVRKGTSNLLLIDNTLVVTGLSVEDMQIISPLIGYLFIQKYFTLRDIKSLPKVNVLTEKNFIKYRQKDAKNKLNILDSEIIKMQDSVSSVSATIQFDKDEIKHNKDDQQNILDKRDKEYNDCLSEGTYTLGIFTPKFTKDYCQKILDNVEENFSQKEKQGSLLSKKLDNDQKKLKEYQTYDTYFKAIKKINTASNNNIPSELGVFEPPNTIRIVFNNSSSTSVADFFENLCHEYLHYASYTPGKKIDSSFFEESLTEYFARQTIKDAMRKDTNIGYPIGVKIINEMTNRIAEVDFADIYFSKDQLGLEKIINLVYGDNFYKDNLVFFESLKYTANPRQAVELANTIMKKIDGNQITEKDFFSTESNSINN